MRWLLFLLVVFAVMWYVLGTEEAPVGGVEETPVQRVEEKPVIKAEDSFISGPVKALIKAESFENSYLEATDEHKKQIEEQLEEDSGD